MQKEKVQIGVRFDTRVYKYIIGGWTTLTGVAAKT